jgi:hypothetical protein
MYTIVYEPTADDDSDDSFHRKKKLINKLVLLPDENDGMAFTK